MPAGSRTASWLAGWLAGWHTWSASIPSNNQRDNRRRPLETVFRTESLFCGTIGAGLPILSWCKNQDGMKELMQPSLTPEGISRGRTSPTAFVLAAVRAARRFGMKTVLCIYSYSSLICACILGGNSLGHE
ncbi:hypothetical protein BKA81DRAFT_374981 [Phyllosticta paracitricarpa]